MWYQCAIAASILAAVPGHGLMAQTAAPAGPAIPAVMHFCAQHCVTFTREGNQLTNYTNLPGQRNEKRVFTIEKFTPDSVVMRRTDTGNFPMTAVYSGRMTGDSISGPGWKITWGKDLNSIPGSDEERAALARKAAPPAATLDDVRRLLDSPPPAPPQPHIVSNNPADLPAALHFCSQHCISLELAGDHYVNTTTDAGGPDWASTWQVESFTKESVILNRTDTNQGRPGFRATYKGQIAPEGDYLAGLAGARITWGAALDRIPGSDKEMRKRFWSDDDPGKESGISMPRNASPPKWIVLPPGASPKFAYFPRNVRAILQSEVDISNDQIPSKCDPMSSFSGDDREREQQAFAALEIGKYLIRAADYKRGYCWIRRSAGAGNVHAIVIAGVAKMLGIGTAEDEMTGHKLFMMAAGAGDVWGTYFDYYCVLNGIGGPANPVIAQKMDLWLSLNPEGQKVFFSIGRDDLNLRAEYARMWTLLEPPTKSRDVCEYTPRGGRTCHTETETDTERLRQRLDEIEASRVK